MEYTANKFKNASDFRTYANAVVNAYSIIIAGMNATKSAARKLNGKVYNKRFIDAIKETLKNNEVDLYIYASDSFNLGYHSLYYTPNQRDVYINGRTYYFDKELCYTTIHNVQRQLLNEDGRIDYSKVETECDAIIENCMKESEKWRDSADNFEKYREQLMSAVKSFNDSLKGINRLFYPNSISQYDWETIGTKIDGK